MNLDPQAIPAGDERLAGSLMNVVLKLQKNRRMGMDATPAPQQGSPEEGAEVLGAIRNQKQDEQKQNAAGAPGALPQEGGQEGGRQRNVRQGEEESSVGQGPQVPGTEEGQQQFRRKMM